MCFQIYHFSCCENLGALIPHYNHVFQLSYLNLGADTEEECDEIEVIVDDGHQRVSALLKGASLDLV